MADEETPDNIDLRFLAAQIGKVLDGQRELRDGQREMRTELHETKAVVAELQIALAATRVDVAAIKADVEGIRETQQNQGARLNAIDGRLALIEKHTGLVKA